MADDESAAAAAAAGAGADDGTVAVSLALPDQPLDEVDTNSEEIVAMPSDHGVESENSDANAAATAADMAAVAGEEPASAATAETDAAAPNTEDNTDSEATATAQTAVAESDADYVAPDEPAHPELAGMTVIVSPAEDHTAPSSPTDGSSAAAPERPQTATMHPSAEQIAAESTGAGNNSSASGSDSVSHSLSSVNAYFDAKRAQSDVQTTHFREQQKLYRAQEVAQDHAALAPHLALCHRCVHATVAYSCADCGGKDYCAECSALVHKFASTRSHVPKPIEGALVLQPGQDTKPATVVPGKNSSSAAPAAAAVDPLDGINEDEGEDDAEGEGEGASADDTEDEEGSGAPRVTFAATASAVSATKDEEYEDDTGTASEPVQDATQCAPAVSAATADAEAEVAPAGAVEVEQTTAAATEQPAADAVQPESSEPASSEPAPEPAAEEPAAAEPAAAEPASEYESEFEPAPVADAESEPASEDAPHASPAVAADASGDAEASRHEAAATAAAAMASAAIHAAATNAAQIQFQQQQQQAAAAASAASDNDATAEAAAPATTPAHDVAVAATPAPASESTPPKAKKKEKEKEKTKSHKKASSTASATAPAPAHSPTAASASNSAAAAPSPTAARKKSSKKKKAAPPAPVPVPAPVASPVRAPPAAVPRQKQPQHASPTAAKSPSHNDAAAAAAARAAQLAEWESAQAALHAKALQDAKDARALKRAKAGFPETDGLGVLEHVFQLLVQEDSQPRAPPALAGFRVPYTVLFHGGAPFSELVTDAAGYLRQRHWGQLSPREVVSRFLAPQGRGYPAAGSPRRPEVVVAVAYSCAPGVDAQEISVGQLYSLFGLVAEDEAAAAGASAEEEYAAEWDRSPSLARHASLLPAPAPRPSGNFILQRVVRSSPSARACIVYHATTSWVDGRAGGGDVPLKGGKSFGRITECSNTQSALCVKVRSGRAPVQTNVPAGDTYEGAVFHTLAAAVRRFVAETGLGTPVRFSAYCTFAEEEPEPGTSGAGGSASARMKWYWCFSDLLQLNSVHQRPDGSLEKTGVDSANGGGSGQKKKKSASAAAAAAAAAAAVSAPLVLNNLDRSSCAKCLRRFRVPPLDADKGTAVMLRQVLLKWVPTRRFEYPEELFAHILGVDTDPARADWYRCVVSVCTDCLEEIRRLKTIPARTQLAPWLAAAAAAAAAGVGARSNGAGVDAAGDALPSDPAPVATGGSGGSKVVLPYLSKAASMHPDAPGFAGILSPPEARRVGARHVSMAAGLGLGDDPLALKRGGTKRAEQQHGQQQQQQHGLSSSASAPALLHGKKHAIAGGHGTAPREPHYPKSRHHRGAPSHGSGLVPGFEHAHAAGTPTAPSSSSAAAAAAAAWNDEMAHGSASASPSKQHKTHTNGALPALLGGGPRGARSPERQRVQAQATPISPYSSGQKRMQALSPTAGFHAQQSQPHSQGDSDADRERERERERQRERALGRALQESRRSGELYPHAHHAQSSPSSTSSTASTGGESRMRNSKSVASLKPLESPVKFGAHGAGAGVANGNGNGTPPAAMQRAASVSRVERDEEDEYANDAVEHEDEAPAAAAAADAAFAAPVDAFAAPAIQIEDDYQMDAEQAEAAPHVDDQLQQQQNNDEVVEEEDYGGEI